VEESGAAVREMVASINSINGNLEKSKSAVDGTVAAVRDLEARAGELNGVIENQAAAVAENSASLEQMAASIRTVAKSTAQAKTVSDELQAIALAGKDKIQSTIAATESMTAASDRIAESVQGISKIAASTNLLAMNAAIEAAHAGAAGAGFAVVAGEIRNLAENAGKEARQIKELMKGTTESVRHGAALSVQAGSAFESIMARIGESVKISTEIAQAMQEQETATRELLTTMSGLIELSKTMKTANSQNAEGHELVARATAELERIQVEIVQASQEQMLGGREIISALEQLQLVAHGNKDAVAALNGKVAEFRIGKGSDLPGAG
jgi:methyl-accepting chemotaxis protein